ncbi:MAG: PHP domain-containing protein [Deltaproteobacteria bacterium]|nr:PHP domain-containing protein [Deltaproteobacteria bacterium]
MLDLHTHSTASDGTLSPSALIHLAKKINLFAVALCDHDTTDGLDEAMETARRISQTFVPGIELSANHNQVTIHVVGLYIDHSQRALKDVLVRTQQMRDTRNPKIITALQQLGIDISLNEVEAVAKGNTIGRPHIAEVLQKKGVVSTADQAFAKYLGVNGSAHVPKDRLTATEAIHVIRAAGGVPILAHPHLTGLKGDELDTFVGELTSIGLQGIEVFYSGYKSSRSAEYTRIAKHHDLVRSGGSDFHGASKPNIRLGRGIGNLYVRDDLLEPIRQLAGR